VPGLGRADIMNENRVFIHWIHNIVFQFIIDTESRIELSIDEIDFPRQQHIQHILVEMRNFLNPFRFTKHLDRSGRNVIFLPFINIDKQKAGWNTALSPRAST
jgi:hypothetical protein